MKDFKIIYTRGSGPGGQHKNKVETCVVITHIPTGMTERCQDTRSRYQNEKLAMKRLQKKLDDHVESVMEGLRKLDRDDRIKNPKVVRTYNFQRNEVKDHLTGKRANLKKVLDGNVELVR
jgi:peptide chain release factor 1